MSLGPSCAKGRARARARHSSPVTVFAAASLAGAFAAAELVAAPGSRGVTARYSFAGSQALAAQIAQGAPADVFAAADRRSMDALARRGLVDGPVVFARNTLEIAVARGNPKRVAGLEDLARPDLTVVLGDPASPIGSYTDEALRRAGVTVDPSSLELDVKSALAKVEAGDADAAVVYVTDVAAAGGKTDGVPIPESQNVIADYTIAVVRRAQHRAAARAFVEDVLHGDVGASLRARGFLPPE